MDTLVNSVNGSFTDLKAQTPENILVSHPIYKHYDELHYVHGLHNLLSASLDQSIWPELTGVTLVGDEKITFRSRGIFVVDDAFLSECNDFSDLGDAHNSSYTFFHLGSKLSGHSLIVHGGLLATLLDELTCILAFQNFPSKKGVTANLNINYFKPCMINSYVMVKCTLIKKSGRKCWVKGQIYKLDLDADIEGSVPDFVERKENLLSECECLVIEPRWVHELSDKK